MFNERIRREYASVSIASVVITVSLLSVFTIPLVRAASESDMGIVAPKGTGNGVMTGSSSSGSDNNNNNGTGIGTGSQKIILTASASPQTRPGKDANLIVTAHTNNGTAVSAADIQVQTTNYNNHTERINLRGVTDKTGDFGVKFPIPDTAKTGQWLVVVQGNKTGFENDSISTGFAVTSFKGKDG